MKKIFFLSLFVFLACFFTKTVEAYDPLSISNNKFGIHVQNENDFEDAAKLVNSSGGDWGYITFVIAENEKDTRRWQSAFDKARKLHLIPIVRIATTAEGSNWRKPDINEIPNWVTFLDSLNWVVQNRYVVIGNEPNHAKEWGGRVNPKEYSQYLYEFSKQLKAASSDYFILPAGLDLAANNSKSTMDATNFYRQMFLENKNVFDFIDGLSSHSYPNPNFSGSEKDSGKKSIRGYEWELSFLKTLGYKKNLPVFITETGWAIKDSDEIGKRFEYAFKNVWSDPRVVSVTPFILNYPSYPFEDFSWKDANGIYKKYYYDLQNYPKIKGEPIQIVKARILGVFVSPIHLVNTSFNGAVLAQNLGQSIWATPEIEVVDESRTIEIKTQEFNNVEPFGYKLVLFKSNTKNAGTYKIPLNLTYKGRNLSDTYPIEFVVLNAFPKDEPETPKVKTKLNLVISWLNDKIRVILNKLSRN